MRGLIEIDIYPSNKPNPVYITYNGKIVEENLSFADALIYLAGMLADGPQDIKMSVPDVGCKPSHIINTYESGRSTIFLHQEGYL